MHSKPTMRIVLLSLAGCVLTLPALAQWQWIDKDGRKVFSDRAPPADIQPKNILLQPGERTPGKGPDKAPDNVPGSAASATAMPSPALRASGAMQAASGPKLAAKDSQLEMRKKQAEDLEKAQKQADAEKLALAKADNCERAKKAQASLSSGVRIAVTNAKGEREFMDDKARLSETERLQAIADKDCVK